MTLDLYSYGRALHTEEAPADDVADPVYACDACGCSARTKDPALLRTVGWRLLTRPPSDGERPALCPRCARRWTSRSIM